MGKRSSTTRGLLPAHPERVWSLSQLIGQTGRAGVLAEAWQVPRLMGSKEKSLPGRLMFEIWEPNGISDLACSRDWKLLGQQTPPRAQKWHQACYFQVEMDQARWHKGGEGARQ